MPAFPHGAQLLARPEVIVAAYRPSCPVRKDAAAGRYLAECKTCRAEGYEFTYSSPGLSDANRQAKVHRMDHQIAVVYGTQLTLDTAIADAGDAADELCPAAEGVTDTTP